MQRRILVIANKWFEVDPLVAVLTNAAARPTALVDMKGYDWPRAAPASSAGVIDSPRLTIVLGDVLVEVWCIQDLMDPKCPGGYSSTQEKVRVLPLIFGANEGGASTALVIAFGTAAMPGPTSFNGSVVLGTRVFMHNPYRNDPDASPSQWNPPDVFDRVIGSKFPRSFFDGLSAFESPVADIQQRLLAPLAAPAAQRVLFAEREGVAVSSVNVVDPSQYGQTDPAALAAASQAKVVPVVSLESTHGVIRAQLDAPFLFVSGITNGVGRFGQENVLYTQNFVAAHNAAIVLAWLLPSLADSKLLTRHL